MFDMKAKVIVDAGDILLYATRHRDMSWNSAHDLLFGQYYSYLGNDLKIIELEYLDDYVLEPAEQELIEAFMDHYELEEFFWAGH